MESLRDIQNALRSGLPLYRDPLGNLEGYDCRGFWGKLIVYLSTFLSLEAIQVLNPSKALASLRQINLGSFFLDPEDNRKLSMGAIWTLLKEQGFSNLV
jgi:hypothetical protein